MKQKKNALIKDLQDKLNKRNKAKIKNKNNWFPIVLKREIVP